MSIRTRVHDVATDVVAVVDVGYCYGTSCRGISGCLVLLHSLGPGVGPGLGPGLGQ